MKLSDAYLCPQCDEVVVSRPHPHRCPSCTSNSLLPLFKVLGERPQNRGEGAAPARTVTPPPDTQ